MLDVAEILIEIEIAEIYCIAVVEFHLTVRANGLLRLGVEKHTVNISGMQLVLVQDV